MRPTGVTTGTRDGQRLAPVRYLPSADPAAQWAALTRRSVALCRQDRALWTRCMARADALEAAGTDPLTAVRRALDEHGG